MSELIHWISPEECLPPHGISHPNKVFELAEKMQENGWGKGQEPLVGYWLNGWFQLLSGTHRHGAAILVGLAKIPVVMRPIQRVKEAFGDLEKWHEIMKTASAAVDSND
jgi:hypothetical protein